MYLCTGTEVDTAVQRMTYPSDSFIKDTKLPLQFNTLYPIIEDGIT